MILSDGLLFVDDDFILRCAVVVVAVGTDKEKGNREGEPEVHRYFEQDGAWSLPDERREADIYGMQYHLYFTFCVYIFPYSLIDDTPLCRCNSLAPFYNETCFSHF